MRETSRDERRPERTVYEVTEDGPRTLQRWLHTMLSAPERRYPDLPAALSFLSLVSPDEARHALEARAEALSSRLSSLDAAAYDLPRLFLVEDEYEEAITRAKLEWVRSLIDDLGSGRLLWSEEWFRSFIEPAP